MASLLPNSGKRKAEFGIDDANAVKLPRSLLSDDPIVLELVDDKSVGEGFKCSICLDVLNQPVEIVVDGCHHIYCFSCLTSIGKNDCPQCRRPFHVDNVKAGWYNDVKKKKRCGGVLAKKKSDESSML